MVLVVVWCRCSQEFGSESWMRSVGTEPRQIRVTWSRSRQGMWRKAVMRSCGGRVEAGNAERVTFACRAFADMERWEMHDLLEVPSVMSR